MTLIHQGMHALLCAVALQVSPAWAAVSAEVCGPLRVEGQAGPYDYRLDLALQRNPRLTIQEGRTDKLILADVEKNHFSRDSENLIRPISRSFGGDLSYLLKVYPNHHRGLITMTRLVERQKSEKPTDLAYSAECYFERAIRFVKDDLIVKMLYAQYLGARQRTDEAAYQLDTVVSLAGDNSITLHNVGLLYIDIKAYDKAAAIARRIYAEGYPNSHLRDALKRAGHWTEERSKEAAAPGSSAARPDGQAASTGSGGSPQR